MYDNKPIGLVCKIVVVELYALMSFSWLFSTHKVMMSIVFS